MWIITVMLHRRRLGDDLVSGLSQVVTKFEDSMSKYNINTTECMQKALCLYIQSTEQAKEKSGINSFVDSSLNALTRWAHRGVFAFFSQQNTSGTDPLWNENPNGSEIEFHSYLSRNRLRNGNPLWMKILSSPIKFCSRQVFTVDTTSLYNIIVTRFPF